MVNVEIIRFKLIIHAFIKGGVKNIPPGVAQALYYNGSPLIKRHISHTAYLTDKLDQ